MTTNSTTNKQEPLGGEKDKQMTALQVAREALHFYANQEHFHMHQPDEWDTVSGEPQNFYEDSNNTATVEDGSVAKQALETIAGHERIATAFASQQAGAAGASEVKTWQERMGITPDTICLASDARPHMEAEIADLRAQLARKRQGSGEPIYQVQFIENSGSSAWRDASEDAYHTFTPEHRRILYTTPAAPVQGEPVREVTGVSGFYIEDNCGDTEI